MNWRRAVRCPRLTVGCRRRGPNEGNLPERVSLARWFGALLLLGIAGCVGDAQPEPVESAEESVTEADTAALQAGGCWPAGADDTQKTCGDGFFYSVECHAKAPSPACPTGVSVPCSPYSAGFDPSCNLVRRESRQWSTAVPGHFIQVKVCMDDPGGGRPICDFERTPALYTSCTAIAQGEIDKLQPEARGAVTFTAVEGEIETSGTSVWASCDVSFSSWPVYTKVPQGTCRHASHALAPASECGVELRRSAPGASLAQVRQEAQSAWEALDGVGPVPLRVEPTCTNCTNVLPTDRQDGQTPGVIEGAASVSADGAAQYSMPLWLPEGRAGLAPALSLTYSSRGGDGLL